MRLVVLDTNVRVSAAIKPESAPARLVTEWVLQGKIQTVVSPWIIEEYREVSRRAKFRRYGFPPGWLEFVIEESLRLPDPAAWSKPGLDPEGLPFLALAQEGGAWLVTGDLKHFPGSIRSGIKVLSPADYLAHLENEL